MNLIYRYKFILVLFLVASWIFSVGLAGKNSDQHGFHSPEIQKLIRSIRDFSYQTNDYFTAAGICVQCHGKDPGFEASVDANGIDINVVDDWAGTMMANSAKDPFWRAKVSHEILVNPGHQNLLEGKCTSCHSPLGHFNAKYLGQSYTIASLETDSVGLDGVSCGACHQLKDTLTGKTFSGDLFYDTTHTAYGPYINPFAGPMQGNIGMNVQYGSHINNAGLCAGCHTLITETVDLSGTPTGDHFIEQATYHEWLNSDFNTETNSNGKTCQDCHMPRTTDSVKLAYGFTFLDGRSPFGKHHLTGPNKFMLELLKNNRTLLTIYSTPSQLDSAIARAERILYNESADLFVSEDNRTADTVFYSVELTNKTGHKFPSGYPSRRAWIEFVVMDDSGDTLFQSGVMNGNYEISGQNASYEPHYNLISQSSQVQIYEMVSADINGNPTTVLERGYVPVKDNRIAPAGFTTTHVSYDTVKIYGNALNDPDFNKNGAAEGTGKDVIHFHIPLNGFSGNLNVTTRLFYQSVPHRWLSEMFAYNSAEIDLFRNIFNAADHTPVLVAERKTGNLFNAMNEPENDLKFIIYPNPGNGYFVIGGSSLKIKEIQITDLKGTLIPFTHYYQSNAIFIDAAPGIYMVRIKTENKVFIRKIILSP